MGYVSIFLGFAIVVILMIRRWSPLMVGLAAASAVIFLNGMEFGSTMSEVYFKGFSSMFESLFPIIF